MLSLLAAGVSLLALASAAEGNPRRPPPARYYLPPPAYRAPRPVLPAGVYYYPPVSRVYPAFQYSYSSPYPYYGSIYDPFYGYPPLYSVPSTYYGYRGYYRPGFYFGFRFR